MFIESNYKSSLPDPFNAGNYPEAYVKIQKYKKDGIFISVEVERLTYIDHTNVTITCDYNRLRYSQPWGPDYLESAVKDIITALNQDLEKPAAGTIIWNGKSPDHTTRTDSISRLFKEEKGADLMALPNGTRFTVINGNWDGEIIDKEDGKYIRNEVQEFKITEDYRYSLWLENVRFPES